jgi:hypothetical protein
MNALKKAGMWKMQASKIGSNNAQDVLCSRNTETESNSMTYAATRHVSAVLEELVDIAVRKKIG